jgi:hypothetical protein
MKMTKREKKVERDVVRLANDISEFVDGQEVTVAVGALMYALARVAVFGGTAYGKPPAATRALVREYIGLAMDECFEDAGLVGAAKLVAGTLGTWEH